MTREEVVKWLESLKREVGKAENCTLWHYAESIDVAIKALSAEVVQLEQTDTHVIADALRYISQNTNGKRKEL